MDTPWTQKIITMIKKKDIAGLLKKGFHLVSFRRNGYADVQADLEDIEIPENEINNYKYDHTAVKTGFYVYFIRYSKGKATITICVPSGKVPELKKGE